MHEFNKKVWVKHHFTNVDYEFDLHTWNDTLSKLGGNADRVCKSINLIETNTVKYIKNKYRIARYFLNWC